MGYIPSYKALQDANIPSKSELAAAMHHLESGLQALLGDGLIASALIYGSVPRNDHSRTSDIDTLVRYNQVEALYRLRQLRIDTAQQFHGPRVDFSPLFEEFAPTPLHRGGVSFLNHLKANIEEKIIVGENPLTSLWLLTRDSPKICFNAEEIGFYFDGTARKFVSYDGDETYRDFLRGIRERYKHVVREAVQIVRQSQLPVEDEKAVDTTRGLMKYFRQDFASYAPILAMLQELTDADSRFAQFVEKSQQAGRIVTLTEYREELKALEDMFPVFMHFTIEVCRVLRDNYFNSPA